MVTGSDFFELVRSSRTYRRFDEGAKVSREELLALVDTARFCPCGNNLQVLRFRVITDEEGVSVCLAHHKWAGLIRDWDGPAPGERPVAYIAICAPAGQGKNPLRNQDAGIAAQTIMLAAAARGLGGCMVKSFDAGLSDDLGLVEEGYECLLLLALGHPTERVVLEEAGPDLDVAYWHDEDDVNHVPKLPLSELVI